MSTNIDPDMRPDVDNYAIHRLFRYEIMCSHLNRWSIRAKHLPNSNKTSLNILIISGFVVYLDVKQN